jgi:membrane associated rhomboid family serine protease
MAMGFQDRDYIRTSAPDRWAFNSGRVCKTLVVVNIGFFLLQLITADGRGPDRLSPFTEALLMDPQKVFFEGQIWRLLTAAFLHDTHSAWHIIINMVILWYFGQDVEELYGPREFLAFYLTAAILSNLVWGATAQFAHPQVVEPGLEWLRRRAPTPQALGASGAIFAVIVVCACHYPFRTILLFFILPMPLWLVVSIYVLVDLVSFLNRNAPGVAVGAHLAGAAFGFTYYKTNFRILNAWARLKGWFASGTRRPASLRLYSPPRDERHAFDETVRSPMDEQLEAKVDAVLAKLSRLGREHLTEDEKQILERAAEVFRRRRG